MSSNTLITPTIPEQQIYLSPYSESQRIHYGDVNYSTHYIDLKFNNLSKILNKNGDVVVDGLNLTNISIDQENYSNFTLTMSPGRLISNSTFIKLNDNINITYNNANVYEDSLSNSNNYFLLISQYVNLPTLHKNDFKLALIYVNNNVPIDEFNSSLNRLVFAKLLFEKDPNTNNITNIYQDFGDITINDKTYKIRPECDLATLVDGGEVLV